MYTQEITVNNEVGLHARPATFFIQKANEFKSGIWVEKEDRRVNAKSLLGVLSLGIVKGTTITLIADGADEKEAVEASGGAGQGQLRRITHSIQEVRHGPAARKAVYLLCEEAAGVTKEELREKANDLPLVPGVYLMMDKTGRVIYVGKAKKLKNRVSQYFQDSASHTAKTRNMVSQVDRFDTIFVTSEFEALVLENSLIKRHMPRYNILLKDDKGYPFVRLSKEAYPRFSLVNKMANDGARYFGPFGGRFETRQALDAVCAALRLPTCSRKFPRDIGAERPCLNFHMGRCDGFCRPEMTAEAYNRRIEQAVQLLEGRCKQLLRDMTAEMEAEAEALRFEQAALLRDRINAIGALSKKQTVIAGLCADTDIWGLYRGSGKSCYAILHMEEGNLAGRETELFSAPNEETEAEMLSALTAQYYLPRAILPQRDPAARGDGGLRRAARRS